MPHGVYVGKEINGGYIDSKKLSKAGICVLPSLSWINYIKYCQDQILKYFLKSVYTELLKLRLLCAWAGKHS